MSRHSASSPCAADRQHGWRRALQCGLLALGMAFPAVAHPITLAQLLRMPLEQLLRLEVSPAQRHSTLSAPDIATERRHA